jgi:hypothetical protein
MGAKNAYRILVRKDWKEETAWKNYVQLGGKYRKGHYKNRMGAWNGLIWLGIETGGGISLTR